MPATCGLACEVCVLGEKGFCPINGCVAGTDPAAPEKLEKFTSVIGHPCYLLDCAIKKGVDHCLRCDEFPCDIHYNKQQIYSNHLLDLMKSVLQKK